MKVKLLKNILDGDRLKVTKRRNKNWHPPRVVGDKVEQCAEEEYKYIPYLVGAVVEVSTATAEKWVAAGLAELAE